MTIHPWFYNTTHPWHWLTYGQNAAALQALCAFLALIGLGLYTAYTRRMMRLNELTRRASMTPVFTAKEVVPHYLASEAEEVCRISMTIRNIGEGPAAIVWAWHQPVSDTFSAFDSGILTQSPTVRLGHVSASDMLRGDSMEIHFDAYDLNNPTASESMGILMHIFPPNRRWLFVVDSIDQAGGRHQLKIVRNPGEDSPTDVSMAHALGDTFGERWIKLVARTVEILRATKNEIRKLRK